MNLRKILYTGGLALLFVFAATSITKARVYLDITSPDFRKVPFAVPYFSNKIDPDTRREGDRDMAALLAKALEFHGFISVVPPQKYNGSRQTDWARLGVDYTIISDYRIRGDSITFEFRLYDISENRMIAGKRYKGSLKVRDRMILRFCDEVVYQLTGERGISLTSIAFSSQVPGGFKEIFVADVLGKNVRQITKHKNLAVSPKFSPDGSQLAYTSYHPGNPNLYVTNWQEAKTTRAISRRAGLNLAPAWSPDAKTMVITASMYRLPGHRMANILPSYQTAAARRRFMS
jgi:TolB protein